MNDTRLPQNQLSSTNPTAPEDSEVHTKSASSQGGRHPDLMLEPATLCWTTQGPESVTYGDRYFHPEDGAGESRYVFLEHNRLPERFAALQQETFIIVETGFGTGLNCLETIRLFQQLAPSHARLQFVSCDKHPLRKADLVRTSAQWPHLSVEYSILQQHYPPIIKGTHCLRWPDPRIQILLYWDDITKMLDTIHRADAWFLDGFAPSRNASMWSEQLFQHMARSAHSGTTFATFTAASVVRRGLSAMGFNVTRTRGYGHKRHMLHGVFTPESSPHPSTLLPGSTSTRTTLPSSSPPSQAISLSYTLKPPLKKTAQIAIVGAGIAGVITAFMLAEAGFTVTLFDTNDAPCQDASGNPQAVLYTRLSCADQAHNRFHNTAFQCCINHLERLSTTSPLPGFFPCGTYDVLTSENFALWKHQLTQGFLDHDWVQAITANEHPLFQDLLPNTPLMHFPRAGWFQPATFATALLARHNIEKCFSQEVIAIEAQPKGGWLVTTQTSTHGHSPQFSTTDTVVQTSLFDAVILCCPKRLTEFVPTLTQYLKPLPGQINQIPSTPRIATLPSVITGPCTILPGYQGHHTIGSSYRPLSTDTSVRHEDSLHNLNQLRQLSPALATEFALVDAEKLPARANCRWNTTDYLPLVGPIALPFNATSLSTTPLITEMSPALKENHHEESYHDQHFYLNTAHGSRGFTQCWLAAEILLSYLNNTIPPLDQRSINAVHPSRFLRRKLRKRSRRRFQK